jgi:NAD(P)-dependent dehydrogenase (short-subunit alcohol dehydrogenase family)
MGLGGTVALVVEVSGDIGRAIAFDLLGAGAEVFMPGRSMARLDRSPAANPTQEKCHFVVADLTDNCAVEHAAAEISARNRLDVLVLSSGIYKRPPTNRRSSPVRSSPRQITANLLGDCCRCC